MVVLTNRRLGPASELLVSREVAEAMLRATAAAAQPEAEARWEHELVHWLEDRASQPPGLAGPGGPGRQAAPGKPAVPAIIDVSEIAWTPDHFDRQRRFLLAAIERAAAASEHSRPLRLWARMIEAHPRDSVQFGRRWTWHPSL
jgi:hypothetical protein